MTAESDHTTAIITNICTRFRFIAYCNGLVIIRYLSILMAQRLSMDAEHNITSSEVQMSQTTLPSVQSCCASYTAARGMTSPATRRSDTANDAMRRFDGVRSLRTITTAEQTSMLPRMVPTMSSPHDTAITAIRQTRGTTASVGATMLRLASVVCSVNRAKRVATVGSWPGGVTLTPLDAILFPVNVMVRVRGEWKFSGEGSSGFSGL